MTPPAQFGEGKRNTSRVTLHLYGTLQTGSCELSERRDTIQPRPLDLVQVDVAVVELASILLEQLAGFLSGEKAGNVVREALRRPTRTAKPCTDPAAPASPAMAGPY